MEKGARIVLQMAKGNFVTLGKYLVVLHTVGGDSKDWGEMEMTKQEFWRLVAANMNCDTCPVNISKTDNSNSDCYKDCAGELKKVYARLECKEND
jgi:hypothetical protein